MVGRAKSIAKKQQEVSEEKAKLQKIAVEWYPRGFWDQNAGPYPGWLVAAQGLKKKNGPQIFSDLWGQFEY